MDNSESILIFTTKFLAMKITKKILTSSMAVFISFTSILRSQNVGISATGVAPHISAMLDIDGNSGLGTGQKKGLLIPRIALQNSTDNTTISSPPVSLLVYNTGTGGLTPAGYYYWDGSQWVKLVISGNPASDAWLTLGNAGTNPAIHFVGTTDNTSLVFRTNNIERMRITNQGQVGIGTTSPVSPAILDITSSNKGVIFPRVALLSATDVGTIPGVIDGIMVYNTSTTGSGNNAVTPGYYYWQNNRWNKFQTNGYAGVVSGVHNPTTPNHLTTLATSATSFQYMGSYIDLPPGKWIVFIYELISPYDIGNNSNNWDGSSFDKALWVRCTLSNSSTSFSYSSDIIGSPLASGALVAPSGFGMVSGALYVYNSSGTTKRYYLWANMNQFSTTCGAYNFAANYWGENQFFAIPAE